MNEIQLLGGKVVKTSLPQVQPPSGPDSPTLKRLLLPQGELAQFYDSPEGIRYIAFIELNAGNPRGNHYHKIKEEWVYVIRGELTLLVLDLATNASAETALAAGDLVRISTQVVHTLKVIQPGQAVEFSSARFDPADIYRHVLA